VRLVKAKQAQARSAALAKAGKRQLTDAQKKEIMDLQEQTAAHTKDLRGVQYKVQTLQREVRMGAATKAQIDSLPTDVPLYRACGKAFLSVPNCDYVKDKLSQEQAGFTKEIKDLMDRQEYLERRINSNNANFRELTQGL
jgi:chaperonin cofactor prefoldin